MPPETATAAAPARTATRELFYAEALNEALAHEMARDERVLIFGEDVAQHGGAFGVTKGLLERFGGRRVRNTPISEIGIVGAAGGAPLTGLRPGGELLYVGFPRPAVGPIVNQGPPQRFLFG